MNKFGTKEMPSLIEQLREAAKANSAPHLTELLASAAETLKAADGYYMRVEGSLV